MRLFRVQLNAVVEAQDKADAIQKACIDEVREFEVVDLGPVNGAPERSATQKLAEWAREAAQEYAGKSEERANLNKIADLLERL